MEGRIKAGKLRHMGQGSGDLVDACYVMWLVFWCEFCEIFDVLSDFWRDAHGRRKLSATVNNAMSDSGDLVRIGDGRHHLGHAGLSRLFEQPAGQPLQIAIKKGVFNGGRSTIDGKNLHVAKIGMV